MAISGENVEPTVQIIIEKEKAEFEEAAGGWADPFGNSFISEEKRILLRNIKRVHFVGEVANGDAKGFVIAEARGVDPHGAASEAIGIEGYARAGSHFLE